MRSPTRSRAAISLILRDELGDLLLQVVFHARIAEETGAFDFGGVVAAITQKMIRRHPHVFGDAKDCRRRRSARMGADQGARKRRRKQRRRARRGDRAGGVSSTIFRSPCPASAAPSNCSNKASSVGFDWNDIPSVLDKIREETAEIEAALDTRRRRRGRGRDRRSSLRRRQSRAPCGRRP